MKGCKNCYWYDKCDHKKRCEYYDPLLNADSIILREYKDSQREREEDAKEIIQEMNA